MVIDFDTDADGHPVQPGTYVSDEWESLGLTTLLALGGVGNRPRIFDTKNPGTQDAGDPDLGAPNKKCHNASGTGIGEGGEPGKPGENCMYQGNALIVQENNYKPQIPDDNAGGGTIYMYFASKYVYTRLVFLTLMTRPR
jgi:hypothetical protein